MSESNWRIVREGFWDYGARICATSAYHRTVYHWLYLCLAEEFTVHAVCQIYVCRSTLKKAEIRKTNAANGMHHHMFEHCTFYWWHLTVFLCWSHTSEDLWVFSVRLPKAINVSRKARGEIIPALSLLSGPHPSVIVQMMLWKHNGSAGGLRVWLMRPLE